MHGCLEVCGSALSSLSFEGAGAHYHRLHHEFIDSTDRIFLPLPQSRRPVHPSKSFRNQGGGWDSSPSGGELRDEPQEAYAAVRVLPQSALVVVLGVAQPALALVAPDHLHPPLLFVMCTSTIGRWERNARLARLVVFMNLPFPW